MSLTAIADSILIEPERPKQETKSGLYIGKEKFTGTPKVGRILSIGPLIKNPDFKVGDRIVVHIDLNDVHGGKYEDIRIMKIKEHQILGIADEGMEIE